MLIAENLPFTQVISSCFEPYKDLESIASVDDFEQAQIHLHLLEPMVLLLGFVMPGNKGLETTSCL